MMVNNEISFISVIMTITAWGNFINIIDIAIGDQIQTSKMHTSSLQNLLVWGKESDAWSSQVLSKADYSMVTS